jgi:hypothetical protein
MNSKIYPYHSTDILTLHHRFYLHPKPLKMSRFTYWLVGCTSKQPSACSTGGAESPKASGGSSSGVAAEQGLGLGAGASK